ncbi:MAG TPA: TIM barrel protein [Nakamurella sp.]
MMSLLDGSAPDTEPAVGVGPATSRPPLRTSIATVCISGTLEDKLAAASAAGFDGVEIFEPDFVVSPSSAREVRQRCADLGLSIDLYQPFRDFDSTDPAQVELNLRRADRKFDLMQALGTDLILVCSAVSPTAVDDNAVIAEQLHRLAERAAQRGMRISYEALAWGTRVNTFDRSWDIVRAADHRALGVCLDSFHILSRGSDPAGIEQIPGEKIFFLQLADAPFMNMDVLQWSRHYRLFPGQGTFDLPAFLRHVLAAGYTGPLSLEVFNDVFRQSDPGRAAVDAHRSLLALYESTVGSLPLDRAGSASSGSVGVPADRPVPPAPELGGFAFAELAVDSESGPAAAATLSALGFLHSGRHRSKPVQLWSQGGARVLLNAARGSDEYPTGAAVAAIGFETADPSAAAVRAQAMLAPLLPRRRGADEADLSAVAAPDETAVFFCRTGASDDAGWIGDFDPLDPAAGSAPDGTSLSRIDHVALTQPYDRFDEASLFFRTVLGLPTRHSSEIAAPFGLVRNRTAANLDGSVRIGLTVSVLRRGGQWAPGVTDPQHVAFATDDIVTAARAAAAAGAPVLPVPANYYDDLDARLALPADRLEIMRELNLLYDRTSDGEFWHFYTAVLGGRVFFEVVQRVGGYQGYGEVNSPVRMAAHRRQRYAAASVSS